MNTLTTDRASKRAYISELGGTRVVNFQFSPANLRFSEGGTFIDVVKIGQHFTDAMWISGSPNSFPLTLFIDRTQESAATGADTNRDPYANVRRFPGNNPRYSLAEAVSLAQGLARNTSSGFATSFRRNPATEGAEITPSTYSASPEFEQSSTRGSVGVYGDLENLLYFTRPRGLQLPTAKVDTRGVVTVTDYDQGRFVPPPMCRFFYGSMWKEGYIMSVDYNLSVMNKQLVPQRLEAQIIFKISKGGYLSELVGDYQTSTDMDRPLNNVG